MEPVAAKDPRSGMRGTLGFLTTRIAAAGRKGRHPSLAEMEAELKDLRLRLRARRSGLVGAVGITLQRLPLLLRRDAFRHQPPVF